MSDKNVLGLDIGYGGLKLTGGRADFEMPALGQGLYSKRSTAAPADMVNNKLSGETDGYEVLVNGRPWRTCFDPALLVSSNRNLSEDYSTTEEYKALFHTGLALAGKDRIDLLVTGLPMAAFKDQATVKRLEQQMTGLHEIQPGRFVNVDKTKVIAQPFGGFMEFLFLRADGLDVDDATVVVIDPGTYSVDWSVFSKMAPLMALNSSSTRATYAMLEMVAGYIKAEHGATVPVGDIETKIIEGKKTILAAGKSVVIADYVERSAKEIVPNVMRQILPKIQQLERTPDAVVVVGGGARFYEQSLREMFAPSPVVVPEDPITANARGFYLYGCQQLEEG